MTEPTSKDASEARRRAFAELLIECEGTGRYQAVLVMGTEPVDLEGADVPLTWLATHTLFASKR